MTQDLERLKQQEMQLMIQLQENRKEQAEIKSNLFAEKTGIKVGSLIEWKDGKNKKRGIVSRIKSDYALFPVYAYPLKKDNTPKTCETLVYCDIDKIKVIQQ